MAYFWIDIVAAAVVIIASIVGMCRGFFASLLSLLGFVGTFILAYFFSDKILALIDQIFGLSSLLENALGPTVGNILAVIIAFITTYLLIRLLIFVLNQTIGRLFRGRAMGTVNTFMGFVFGFTKGLAYVALALVAVNIASLIPTVKNWSSTAFEQTYVVGKVYNWVEVQLGNYFGGQSEEQTQTNPETETPANAENS